MLDRLEGDTAYSFDVTIRVVCVATMAFITTLRGSSMVAGNPNDPNNFWMKAKHARFRRELQELGGLRVPSYTIILTISHFKGKPGLTKKFKRPPCACVNSIWVEPTIYLLVLLISQKRLREVAGELVESVDDLWKSDAYELVGVGEGPLFQNSVGEDLSRNDISNQVAMSAKKNGMVDAGLHAFRRDGAIQLAAGLDDQTAADVLGHKSPLESLTIKYSHPTAWANTVAFRSGEAATLSSKLAFNKLATGWRLSSTD